MANPTAEWTKVLVHPLGLAGYALFLVFGLVARAKRMDERRWLFPAALTSAFIALVGSLGLAYLEVGREAHEAATASPSGVDEQPSSKATVLPANSRVPHPTRIKQNLQQVQQKNTAPCSPNVIAAGNVTVTCSETNPNPKEKPSHNSKRTD